MQVDTDNINKLCCFCKERGIRVVEERIPDSLPAITYAEDIGIIALGPNATEKDATTILEYLKGQ